MNLSACFLFPKILMDSCIETSILCTNTGANILLNDNENNQSLTKHLMELSNKVAKSITYRFKLHKRKILLQNVKGKTL